MNISQIIKYEGDNSTFVWKHPCEDFNTTSQLIVHESQEAIFFMNGQALDLFGPGRYTLETQNIPFLSKFINIPTNGETPFHCEVYFINKVHQMAIKWGTDTKVEYIEPVYGFPLKIGANGEMVLQVEDSRKLLVNLVGTERVLDQSSLVSKFRAFLMMHAKSYLAQLIKAEKLNIFEIDEKLETISDALHTRLVPDFSEYGIALKRFIVTAIAKPEDDASYRKFKELHFRQYADIAEAQLRQRIGIIEQQTESQRMVMEAQAMSQKRQLEGYTYQQERGFDVAEMVAQNEAVAEFTNLGVGLGTMAGVGGMMGGMVGGAIGDAMGSIAPVVNPFAAAQPAAFCENCGMQLEAGAAFCDNCGAQVAAPQPAVCKNCGNPLKPTSKFCSKCGTKREG